VAFGTGVMVDGMDFSDDKLLQGRTFSYSDTQRYRVGPNYLQLPINRPKRPVATNQRDGQMTYQVDGNEAGANPHVNYEPSAKGSPAEAKATGPQHTPFVSGHVVRQSISRENDYGQAGDRYRAFSDWERDELIANLVSLLAPCDDDVQQRMIGHLTACDADYGQRVLEGLARARALASAEGTPAGVVR
jgi:catalase